MIRIAKGTERFLAMLLSIAIIFAMIPISTLQVKAEETPYTLYVNSTVSGAEVPVDGATVTYQVTIDPNAETPEVEDSAITTEGKIEIDLSEYADDISSGNPASMKITVTKDGYEAVDKEVSVEDVADTCTISLTATETVVEQNTVSVTVLGGEARVELEGVEQNAVTVNKGTEIPVKITPADGSYIKELMVGGKSCEVEDTEEYNGTVKVDSDIAIVVTIVKEFTVTAPAVEGGTITLNEQEVASLTVDENTEVAVSVSANDGYQISSVTIGGVAQNIPSAATSFERVLTVTDNTAIIVEFVKVFTVTISHNDNGIVDTKPEITNSTNEGGSVTVESGEQIIITADPADNYRVSKVEITGEEPDTFEDNYGTSEDDVYTKTLTADKDYEVVITFAPNRYLVEKAATQNGKIVINGSTESSILVDHDASCTVVVTPDEGYSVATVTVSGNEVDEFKEYEDDNGNTVVEFNVSNITESKEIAAAFVETETISPEISGLFNANDKIRVDGMTYIYSKDYSKDYSNDKEIIFETDKAGIRLYDEKGRLIGEDKNTQSVTLGETISISKIELSYKADNEKTKNWHTVTGVTAANPLRIVIDTDKTESTLTPDEKHSKDFYNGNFNVKVKSEDKGEYSGIAKVEYFVTDDASVENTAYDAVSDDLKTQSGELYVHTNTISAIYEGTISVSVNDAMNNSDYVAVWAKITDRAGNVETVRSENLLVNCTAPQLVSVEIDGTLDEEAKEGYYNNKRTATLIIEDRASSFDEAAVFEGIEITAKDANDKKVIISKPAMIRHHVSGNDTNTHVVTIEFDTDANYTWEISYTNKAGKQLDKSSVQETGSSIYAFTVDKEAPVDSTISFDAGGVWNELLTKLTFGIWNKYSITATATPKDKISRTCDVLYYKSNTEGALSEDKMELETILKELYQEGQFRKDPYTVTADEKFVVYARITDYAGNTLYISTDGAIVDTSTGLITLEPDAPNKNGFYNKDVNVKVFVTDVSEGNSAYSGIKSIDYKVVKDDDYENPTQSGNLYTFSEKNPEDPEDTSYPAYSDLRATWSSTDPDGKIITVDKDLNNSDNVKVIVTVVDNAGNEYSGSEYGGEITLAINVDEVKADIQLDGIPEKEVEDRGYYKMEARTATIVIKERATAFDEEAATAGICVTAVDKQEQAVADAYTIEWDSKGNTHTATVRFTADANYEWSFNYTNKAGNSLDVEKNISTGTSKTPFQFTVDDTAPTGTITVNTSLWDKLLEFLTFGLYSNVRADITAEPHDETSPYEVEYYKTDNPIAMEWEELDNVTFTPYENLRGETDEQFVILSIEKDEQFVIYLKITDYAGNYTYICSDGYIVDTKKSKITLTPSAANGFCDAEANARGEYGLYNKGSNVYVDIKVEDKVENAESCSGIKSVEYWVENNGVKNQNGILYSFDYTRDLGTNSNEGKLVITDWNSETQENTEPVIYEGPYPAQADLKQSWEGTVVIDKELNNSCDVVVYVETVDNAGNEETKSVQLDIDITAPTIDITFDNGNDNNGNTYFDAQRTATIVITERAHHFNEEAATNSIIVNAVDADDIPVENAYTLSDWTPGEDTENPDEKTYTATLSFEKDANYTWSISYTDEAGNTNDDDDVTTSVVEGDSVAPFKFTIDTTAPYGTVKAVSSEGRETEWNSLKNPITFGFWSRQKITISGTADDATSAPIAAVSYYKVSATKANDKTVALTKAELDKVTEWKPFNGLEINKDEQFIVYIKITDLAGNYSYISTNGLIVDHTSPMAEMIEPEVLVTPMQQKSGVYNSNVKVAIQVTDPLVGGTYSGLNTVSYSVLNMGTETQSGILYAMENSEPKQSELLQTWSGNITVDSTLNNSNDVEIVVYAKDNAGNSTERKVAIKIDITNPVINVTYDNNAADNMKYYKENRTATIVVTERNFNPNDVQVTITNTDGEIPGIGSWSKSEGSGNMDNTQWSTTVTYSADGDYTFDIAYTDEANNVCTEIQYGNSVTPTEFTIDKTLPVVNVEYSNNTAENEKYFKEDRTATIRIIEHNFDVNRVEIEQEATLNGKPIPVPEVHWANAGDIHTATIVYSTDGDYKLNVTLLDMAANESEPANYGDSVAGQEFVIDKTISKPVISGVENGKAYKEDVIPTISFNDVNYESYDITLERISMDDYRKESIKTLEEHAQGCSGSLDIFDKTDVKNDGIYTLTVTMLDKAGNQEVEEVTFTINRYGSVYKYSESLVNLINAGYIKIEGENEAAITENLVITEYNADRLNAGSLKILITRDGEAIEVDYTTNPKVINEQVATGKSGWYEYVYTINASNFAEDGAYKITLVSEYSAIDAEGNTKKYESTSVPDNSVDEKGNRILDTMSFIVDTTPPEIRNVVNLEKAIVNGTKLDVTYTIVDVGGLQSIEIILNGETIKQITEFGDHVFNYSDKFEIKESTETQTVRIKVTDLAGNVTDTATEEFRTDKERLYAFNDSVTVSTNFMVRFYANKPLFWGSVSGVVVIAGAITAISAVKSKKKGKREEE